MTPRERKLFDSLSEEPFELSRSKLELFVDCARCFSMDRKFGIDRVSGPQFTLNMAVDELLKKEFDQHRAKGEAHPLMKQYGIDAVPFAHPDIETWRDTRKGIRYLDPDTNFLFYGAIDDVWVNPEGQLMIVDYKATSTRNEITLEDEWKKSYKRQMEIYQWLFRKNAFDVLSTGYFVYVNADKDKEAFDGRLEFAVQIIPYEGNDSWVAGALKDAKKCLISKKLPPCAEGCKWCTYRKEAAKVE